MRKYTPLVLALAIFVLAALALLAGAGQAPALAQTTPDDEIAYIDTAGRIAITDPRIAPGTTAFSYTSPTGGYTDLAVIDANGDGIEEIVGISGPTARILVPLSPGGSAPLFDKTIAGYTYNMVSVGDINNDGHQDVVLQRTVNGGSDSVIEVWQNAGDGRAWTQVFNQPAYGAPWLRIELGNVDGLAGDEIVLMRNGTIDNADERIVIYARNAAGGWVAILNRLFDWPWVDLAVGNTVNQVNGGIAEIVTSRDVIGLPTIIFFQYSANQLNNAPNGTFTHWPYFHDIALGDVNASGDMEAFFVRDPRDVNGVTILAKNFGGDAISAAWINGIALGLAQREIEAGDTDGDGKDELVVASSTSYRIFTEPSAGTANTGAIPLFFRTFPVVYAFDSTHPTERIAFKLGNFDGDGVSTEPPVMVVNKTALTYEMTRAGTNPPSQTFQVTNSGGGSFEVHVDARTLSGGDWLEVTPFDAPAPATFTVGVKNTAALGAGTYDATITVEGRASVAVQNSPQVITVRLIVRPTGPILEVTPGNFAFAYDYGGELPTAQILNIRNVGDGGQQFYTLAVSTGDGGDWLHLNKSSGFTNDAVQVTVTPRTLLPGEYSGEIVVTANSMSGSPVTVPVSLSVTASGMVVTPAEISMLAIKGLPNPSPVEITIRNSVDPWYAYAVPSGDWWDLQAAWEAGELTVSAQESGFEFESATGETTFLSTLDWVLLTPNHGPSPGRLQVTIDTPTAPPGFHRVTILVDGGPHSVNRFQGVDAQMLVAEELAWLPLIVE